MSVDDLSGFWKGHYEQDGARHGISMRISHKGQSLVGSMQDEHTLLMGQLPEPAGSTGPHGAEVITSLPSESLIEGEVAGRRVSFIKRYRGKQATTVWLGAREVSLEIDGHRVWYRGSLDAAGMVLQGEWTIPPLDHDVDGDRGPFELRRQ